jgi:N-acetylglucosaminyl-diphospho-decaprenol L-rhamnosyltransferase
MKREPRLDVPKQHAHLREVPAPETAAIDVSIVIVTWNSGDWIGRCLDALPRATAGLETEIIVHDNASNDGSAEAVADRDGVLLMRAGSNIGFAAGVNAACNRSRGRYVFLLNPDCELAPGGISALVGFLDRNPSVAAAAPLLVDDDGHPQREFQLRRLPTFRTLASEVLLIDKLMPGNRETSRYRYRDLDITRPQLVEQPAATALLLRRDVFESVGPLDERFSPAWFEDVDYCRRLHESGRAVFLVPEVTARHRGGVSLEYVGFAAFTEVWYRNLFRYAEKWFSPREAEVLRWLIIAGMLLRSVAVLFGFNDVGQGRWRSIRAYWTVLVKAFEKWDDSSPSS